MRKQVVSVRLSPEVVSLVDRYVRFLQEKIPSDQPGYVKNRSDYIERAIIDHNIAVFDFLTDLPF